MDSVEATTSVAEALKVSRILWPEFVEEHGCVFLGWHKGSNPPPANDTATGWESFVNHTHIFDEFTNNAASSVNDEVIYNELHTDFVAACELGQKIAKLWVLKLKLDFPSDRFRVYYTQFDNPIVRFHRVRDGEAFWLSDEDIQGGTNPSFKNALIYDTARVSFPDRERSDSVH
jgi:hypothetical protein